MEPRRLLLFGCEGQAGWELQRSLSPLGQLASMSRRDADLEDLSRLRELVRSFRPAVVINAAAYTAVDAAESDLDRARRINATAVGVIAEEARQADSWFVHYSTDYVFDGLKQARYVEADAVSPINAYGRTKAEGENAIRDARCKHLIFRTSWAFAARGANFPKAILNKARTSDRLEVVADQFGAPTAAELIADVTALVLYRIQTDEELSSRATGTYHLSALGETTWYDYACLLLRFAEAEGMVLQADSSSVIPVGTEAYPTKARRPRNSLLDTSLLCTTFGLTLPAWDVHVRRLVRELAQNSAYRRQD